MITSKETKRAREGFFKTIYILKFSFKLGQGAIRVGKKTLKFDH